MLDKEELESKINALEKAKLRYKNHNNQLEDMNYINKLLYEDYVMHAKSIKSRYAYLEKTMLNAISQMSERLKKDRPDFELIKGVISDDFFNGEKIKISDIIMGGYECYYISFDCEYNGHMYAIQIPITSNINIKNFDSAFKNMFAVWNGDRKNFKELICSSYSISEISNAIAEFANKMKESDAK